MSNRLRIAGLRPTISSNVYLASSSLRSCSIWLRSWNVSTPPITEPSSLRSSAVEMRMGIRFPLVLMISAVALTTGLPLVKVRRRAQAPSQTLARNTSEHTRPSASCLRTPVIRSAARLNAVIRHS